MAEEFRVLRPYEFHCQLVSKGRRADGRGLEEVREVKLETDAIRTADSSSLVKLGNTSLVCGCTAQLVTVQEKNDGREEVRVRVELPPICSSPTGYKTQQTAQLLTKTLKNILDYTSCLDKQNLYMSETEMCWSVDVEIVCLNYDGCLLDASLIAIISALKSLKLRDGATNTPERNFKFNSLPVCSSFAVIGDHFICDPNLEEETVAQSIFSITVDPHTQADCHITKIGGKAISTNKLMRCIQLAKDRAQKLQQQISLGGSSTELSKGVGCAS